MAKIGYARISHKSQEILSQVETLKREGCDRIIEEVATTRKERPRFIELLNELEEGDTLCAVSLDRICRNIQEGITFANQLIDKGVVLDIFNLGRLDGSPTSRLIMNVLFSVGQFERDHRAESQRRGIEEAKRAGKYKNNGRPVKYGDNSPKLKHALELMENRSDNGMTVKEICDITGIGRTTLYDNAKKVGVM